MVPYTPRYALKKLLETHAKNPNLVAPAMSLIEPFFVIAESGSYPRSAAEKLDPMEMVRVLAQVPIGDVVLLGKDRQAAYRDADGIEVNKVIFVSDPYCNDLKGLGEYFEETIINLRFSLRMRLDDLTGCDEEWLQDDIECSLMWDGIASAIHAKFGPERAENDTTLSSLRETIAMCLFTYLALILWGDAGVELSGRYAQLIQLLPKAIPLGEKKDEPGTWFVLAVP